MVLIFFPFRIFVAEQGISIFCTRTPTAGRKGGSGLPTFFLGQVMILN